MTGAGSNGSRQQESRLLELFLGGDDDAFKELERCYSRWLRGYFRRLNCSAEDGEDLTQETLLRLVLLRDTDPTPTIRCLRSYIFGLASRVYLNHVRSERARRSRESARPLQVSPVDPVDGEPPVPVDDLLAAICALRWPDRDYLLLCGTHGLGELSHAEVAAVLEIPPQNVARVSSRAMRLLRQELLRRGVRFDETESGMN